MIRLDTLTLPAGLVWIDEFSAHPVAQTVRRTLDGGIVTYYTGTQGGRPITLESEPDAGWITRAQADALALMAQSPGAVYTLTLRGQTFQVVFRHHEPPAFDARPLVNRPDPQPSDFYLCTLKLMTI